ncbi:MAG: hypothetical protein Q7S80_02335 [bacterium]|nr:hypothetical protein [bacterium]
MSEIEGEQFGHETIWQTTDGNFELYTPTSGTILRSEGTNLAIKKTGEFDWQKADPEDLVEAATLSLGAAKLLTESGRMPDFWSNIHLNSRAGTTDHLNVFGRNPTSKSGWGKPVNIVADITVGEEQSITADQADLVRRYMPYWERLANNLKIDTAGSSSIDQSTEEFQGLVEHYETRANGGEKLVWANEKFVIVIVMKPHLNGLHLVIHPRGDYWRERGKFRRPWQQSDPGELDHIIAFDEALIILRQALDAINEANLSLHNPEIHFSGNWAPDLQSLEDGGKLDTSYAESGDPQELRTEKRRHFIGEPGQFETAVHGHLYMTANPAQYVSLPERPENEVPEQWVGIEPPSLELINRVTEVIRGRVSGCNLRSRKEAE